MKTVLCTVAAAALFSFSSAQAADELVKFSIEDTMATPEVSALFPGDVTFYWGDQQPSAVAANFGNFKTSKRTNALGRSREQACGWAMASALDALQQRARREGGNAVINIVSNIKGHVELSSSEDSCLAGSMMVNVALKGDVVKLPE